MEAIAAIIAVCGTLLGAGLTHLFQRRTTERSDERARLESLRQDRTDAFAVYAGALYDYRRVLVHRWFAEHERPGEEDGRELIREIYRLRTRAYEALLRVELLTPDLAVQESAQDALDAVTELHDTCLDRAALDERRASSRAAIRRFVATAAPSVR